MQVSRGVKVNWREEHQRFWDKAQVRHHKQLAIKPKSSFKWFWKIAEVLHKIVTFGKGRSMYTHFFTTWGRTIYTPGDGSGWEEYSDSWKWGLKRHELAHFDHMYYGRPDLQAEINLAQSRDEVLELKEKPWWYRYWHGFQYLFVKLPFKYATYRQEAEYYGYLQQVRQSVWEHDGEFKESTKQRMIKYFHGPGYAWMATKERAFEIVNEMEAQAKKEYEEGILDTILFGPLM
jgi:hypothetical protein